MTFFEENRNWRKINVESYPSTSLRRRRGLWVKSKLHQGWAWDGLPVPRIFVPGIRVQKLKIPGLSQRFVSQSQEYQGFVSHGTTLGQPEFLGLFGTRVQLDSPGILEFFVKKHDLLIKSYTFLQRHYDWKILSLLSLDVQKKNLNS